MHLTYVQFLCVHGCSRASCISIRSLQVTHGTRTRFISTGEKLKPLGRSQINSSGLTLCTYGRNWIVDEFNVSFTRPHCLNISSTRSNHFEIFGEIRVVKDNCIITFRLFQTNIWSDLEYLINLIDGICYVNDVGLET